MDYSIQWSMVKFSTILALLANKRRERIYNIYICAFVKGVCCYFITVNSLAVNHIVQTTFQDSAVGEENISLQSETGTNLSLGAA